MKRLTLSALMSAVAICAILPAPVLAQTAAKPAKDLDERTPGQKPADNSLEHSLWDQSEKAEYKAQTSGERNRDPALNAYVDSVVDKVTGPYSGDVRVYVMDRPFFNASMAPNGYTEVWSGLLLRAETEDELAFVLGHEFAHFRHTHSLQAYKNFKSNRDAALAATMLIAVAGAAAAGNAGSYAAARDISNLTRGLIDVVYLGSIAAYFGYSRETETEADRFGSQYAHQAGYTSMAGAQLWRTLLDETAASDYRRVRNSPTRINIFGSHPLETDRITAIQGYDKALNGGKASAFDDAALKPARAAYRAHIRAHLGDWLKDDLRRMDYGQTLFTIKRLSRDGEDLGLLNFYAGEAYRLRVKEAKTTETNADKLDRFEVDKTQNLEAAATAYKTALQHADAPAETYRQLGDVYRKLERKTDAIEALTNYIKAHPDAEDAWMVEDQIATLNKGGA
ncbi:M48 family metalloprotease [Asticcacaulis sp. SL142]|uniref:M48 family metallopeptidase n=1 Tax=Asticcacaulis sp. SL142 TaxID=2995155 RepID=UPI00226CCB79|nr:M48 family metallopeptidase [Asticcacaulis sp. SL142]WAC48381.1 M48 family metalloprotease [Asticcacaulis sp. SL142]